MVRTVSIPGHEPINDVDLAQPDWRLQIEGSAWVFLMGSRVRNYELVKKHQEEIRAYFQPVAAIRDRLKSYFETIRADHRPLVGVHIRQGDYQDFKGGRHYLQSAQYAAYMRRMHSLLEGRVTFVVCSDAPQSPETFEGLDVRFGPGHLVEDMYALANCDYIIGVPSTFSRWSAFFGRKKLYMIDDPSPEGLTLDAFELQGDRI